MARRRANGESALFYNQARGLWEVRIELPPDPATGKRRRKIIRAKKQKDAIAKLNAAKKDLEKIGDLNTSSPTYEAFVTGIWLPSLYRKRLKPKSISDYEATLKNYIIPVLGERKVDAITQRHVHQVLDGVYSRGLSSRTAQKAYRTLSLTLLAAMRRGLTPRNACDLVDPPTLVSKPREALSLAQAKMLLASTAGSDDFPLILLLLATGARREEALGLKVENIDFRAGTVTYAQVLQRLAWRHGCGTQTKDKTWPCGAKRGADCPKRHHKIADGVAAEQLSGTLWLTTPKSKTSERRVPMIPPLREALRRHIRQNRLKEGDFVFGTGGAPMTPEAFYEKVKAYLAPFGPGYSPHSLRHTATTLMDEAGVSEDHRIAMLGHSSAQMTRHYTHTTTGALAGDLEKFDKLLALEG